MFADHNPSEFAPADPVSLHVYVKNVPKLTVKLYELNTTGIYLDTLKEISTAMNLVRLYRVPRSGPRVCTSVVRSSRATPPAVLAFACRRTASCPTRRGASMWARRPLCASC